MQTLLRGDGVEWLFFSVTFSVFDDSKSAIVTAIGHIDLFIQV